MERQREASNDLPSHQLLSESEENGFMTVPVIHVWQPELYMHVSRCSADVWNAESV